MTDGIWSEEEEIKSLQMERPHLVILGAGASLAAFPNGDKNGRRLPIMRTFAEVVGLNDIFKKANIPGPYDDFESIYSDIAIDTNLVILKKEIESRIFAYFNSLELPDEPTLYDHLVLCLRPKDVIATFNWDPFLCQAVKRNYEYGKAPEIFFLHGNVAFAYCPKCKIGLPLQTSCFQCGHELVRSPLLYPVKKKGYSDNDAIAAHWKAFEITLKNAWALTIFGYGAPKTDIEAVRIMKNAWGNTDDRNLEEIEFIDVKQKEELANTWAPFIHTHHYTNCNKFYDSYIAQFPRRSGEALLAQFMENKFLDPHKFPLDMGFAELYSWLRPRIETELATGK